MFNNFEEFENWLDISKNFDGDTIRFVYKFIDKFPNATVEDYIKCAEKLTKGVPIEEIMARYKRHMASIGENEEDEFFEVSELDEKLEEMVAQMKTGLLKGSTTYVDIIDDCWKWRLGEFSLLTGYNNDGKSLLIRFLCLIKGIMDKWPSAIYAPEDYPATAFFDELIHTASGYSTDKDNYGYIGEDLYRKVAGQITGLIKYVNVRPPKNTIQNVLKMFIPLIEKKGVKICIIDPLIKLTRPDKYVNNDAAWVLYLQTICTDFARRYNVALILVLHQLTPKLQENGTYMKPDKYSIKYGGNFADGADNVLFLQKPDAPKDNKSTLVRFGSLKIKKQKLVATPHEVMFRFNRKTNRYIYEHEDRDIFDFDKVLELPRATFNFTLKSEHDDDRPF